MYQREECHPERSDVQRRAVKRSRAVGEPALPVGSPCRAAIVAPVRFRCQLEGALPQLGIEIVAWQTPDSWPASVGRRTHRNIVSQFIGWVGGDIDGVLLVAPPVRAPATMLPEPVVGGVPAGVVFATTPESLLPWLTALTDSHHRAIQPAGPAGTWAVLSEWDDRYLGRASTFAAALSKMTRGRSTVRRWFANRLNRPALLDRLATGPRWTTYFGHGSHDGLNGYAGVTAEHLLAMQRVPPMGVFWSWACRTLQHANHRMSFGARLVKAGRVTAFVGPVDSVKTTPNALLGHLTAAVAVASSCRSVGDVIRNLDAAVAARKDTGLSRAWRSYRLVGSPFELI